MVEDGLITAVALDDGAGDDSLPYIAPGFVDVHVHGWGGHDAMGGRAALDGMARGLLRQGVTSFLPTAVTAPLSTLASFADSVRDWRPAAPDDGAEPLGFNLEGPFLAESKRGAHDAANLRTPADVDAADLEPLLDGLRVVTIAPELPGALDLIRLLAARGVVVSLGHSAATERQAAAGYEAGARSTTHLFNAMTGVDHRSPGLAVAALLEDDAWVELIADGLHVDPALWPLIRRLKPSDRLLLVSDALPIAGTNASQGTIGGLEGRGPRRPRDARRDVDARRLRGRTRHRRPQPRPVGHPPPGCRGRGDASPAGAVGRRRPWPHRGRSARRHRRARQRIARPTSHAHRGVVRLGWR